MIGDLHLAAACLALASGAFVLLQRKATRRHLRAGRVYAGAMLLVNAAALVLYEQTGRWGPFHVLAAISLCTLAAGVLPLLLGRRDEPGLVRHAYFMAWSYVGLVAAGIAQMTNRAVPWGIWLAVALPSLIVIGIGGVLVHRLVPRALGAALAARAIAPARPAVQSPAESETRP
jgi:uncharacterized membrane protein